MKTLKIFLISLPVLIIIVYSCSKNKSNPVIPNLNVVYEVQQLFADTSWTTEEMSAMTYDPSGDYLYYIRSTNHSPNQVRRYNFTSGQIDTVYSYQSQWDYGMRILNDDFFITRTYDKSILHLTNSPSDTLIRAGIYPDSINGDASLGEINDVTMVNNNIYFVCGNMLTSLQHNGIQYLQGSDFSSVHELLSPAEANWPDSAYGYTRSIISIGSGSTTKFVITTGAGGNIELRDALGSLITADSGYGEAYLQKDLQNRIYVMTGYGSNTILTRWDDSLSNKEEFKLNFTQYGGGNGIRFALRETGSVIEVIMIKYRSREPVFYKTTIPG